jgi:hypothetical protein
MRLLTTLIIQTTKLKMFFNNNTYSLFISQSLIKSELTVNIIQTNKNIINQVKYSIFLINNIYSIYYLYFLYNYFYLIYVNLSFDIH